jgi:RNA polymerase sigma factor for flagellar operon FliA
MRADDDALPPYAGLALADVRLVRTSEDADAARTALLACDAVGFDTESKPTFQKGEVSTGPHLVQLATDRHAYLFQIGAARPPRPSTAPATDSAAAPSPATSAPPAPAPAVPGIDVLRAVLESPAILKVDFGLGDDLRRLHAKLGIDACNVLDLSTALRRGERNAWGAKTAVARFFGQRLQKSRKITTTNWALPRLSDKQLLYAADDAHVALRISRQWRTLPAPAAPAAPARPARTAEPGA